MIYMWASYEKKNVKNIFFFCFLHLFGSARTEWGHLANPHLTWHSYRQEPVAVCAVTLHSSSFNASMKQ